MDIACLYRNNIMVSWRVNQILLISASIIYCSSVFIVIHQLHKIQLPVTEIAVSHAPEEIPSWVNNVGTIYFENKY